MPANQLDPRVKNVWRLNDALWTTLVFGCIMIVPGLMAAWHVPNAILILGIVLGCYVLTLVLCLVVLPPIRYVRWRYEVSEDYLDIAKGIIWRKRYIIPFIRVQNTDTRQGPVLRMFGLASVTVSTAAREHVIIGLDSETAEQLRDRAAELARLAREDV